jgi:rhomboid protease GluP
MQSPTTETQLDPHQDFARRLNTATPRAVVTPTLVAINVAVFVVMAVLGVSMTGGRPEEYLRFGANFAPLTAGGDWWRLITCTFVHFGIAHLAFNMWALWDAGRLTEKLYGNWWFAAIYLFAGVAGSCASMMWSQRTISVGASGAVFGVFGALLAYLTAQRGSVPPEVINRLRISTSIFVVYSLFYGFAQAGIDNAAHVGGLAGGFLMGLIGARPLDRSPGAAIAPRAALALLLAAATLCAAVLLTPDTSRIYQQAIVLQKEIGTFSEEERRLHAAFERIVAQTRAGTISDQAALGELRSTILPAWDQAVAQLGRVELDPGAPARADYDLLLRYAVARRDMIRAVADFLETSNPAYERMINELRGQADEALKLYQQRQKK